MLTLRHHFYRSCFALSTVALLGASGALSRQADPPNALHTQLKAMSGTGLMLAGCQERLQTLDGMLRKAGYSPMRSWLVDGSTMIARWYHPERHTTVLAFAGWQATGNAFSTDEFAGMMRWNELTTSP
ncbi:hypothetical protein [Deinococcus navajonensis]|uniref:Uncharacterized protein n=1 Tax=Deinococcus navajonensis TaxID=309884 RepID=A0ABV8XM77_9DEIO